jgi:ribonuclease P protein component
LCVSVGMAFARAWRRSAAARLSPPAARAGASGFPPEWREPRGVLPAWRRRRAMSKPETPNRTPREPKRLGAFARLTRRPDYQRVARGRRWPSEAFTLQAQERDKTSPTAEPRIGFTATRKIGGAVERNRIRRRLKEAVRLTKALEARDDHDYVLVARRAALRKPFDLLCDELRRAFAAAHAGKRQAPSDRERSR